MVVGSCSGRPRPPRLSCLKSQARRGLRRGQTSLQKICRTSFSHPAFEAECAGAERDRLRAEGGFSLADEGDTGIEHRAWGSHPVDRVADAPGVQPNGGVWRPSPNEEWGMRNGELNSLIPNSAFRFKNTCFSLVSEFSIKKASSSDRSSRCSERIDHGLARAASPVRVIGVPCKLPRMTHVTQSDERRLWILGR